MLGSPSVSGVQSSSHSEDAPGSETRPSNVIEFGKSDRARSQRTFSTICHLNVTSPDILRATRSGIPLSCHGKLLRGNGVALGNNQDYYGKSFQVHELDEFWSHSWSGSTLHKYVTLLMYYNGIAGIVAGCLGGLTVGLLPHDFIVSHLSDVRAGLVGLVVGTSLFVLTLFLWASQRRIFFDKVCIAQQDPDLKKQGIISIGGFVRHSRTLLLLWDRTYFSRVWCVFELAAFHHLRRMDLRKRIHIRPTFHGACAISWFLTLFLFRLSKNTIIEILKNAGMYEWAGSCLESKFSCEQLFDVAGSSSIFLFVFCMSHQLRVIARDVAALSQQVTSFSLSTASCFCCSCQHVHPETGEDIPCDRQLVETLVEQWFGSVSAFDTFVAKEIGPEFRINLGKSYSAVIYSICPCIFEALGHVTYVFRGGNTTYSLQLSVALWFTYVFIRLPIAIECSARIACYLKAPSAHWVGEVARSFIAALITTGCHSLLYVSYLMCVSAWGLQGALTYSVISAMGLFYLYRERMLE